ncbi:unnamed protein product [Spirodela intermedia]|uniref:SMP-LTD domain-containing protein n=1 Tax=Spirodela intermedia TaxID=51605 RepID=A0A7I8J937_SPIIN|nr:unnamed protein product [Spirodela intermedia]CAA6666604.1 unnamed protein product [Spirodela intermedia]
MLALVVGILIGVFAILAAEAVALLAVLVRLVRKKKGAPRGIVWVLEPERIPRITDESSLKVLKEQKAKKRIVEVSPSRKYAKIVGHSLSLMDVDGCQEEATVQLTDCMILAVSGSDLPSKKWAKRYPIKVEGKRSAIYNGSQTFYLYLETSWEKEAWCKALRQASCPDTEKRYAKLRKDFSNYVLPLQAAENQLFIKASELFDEVTEKTSRAGADSSSKVRQFLKKIAKKASKSVAENKASMVSFSNGASRVGEKSFLIGDVSLPLNSSSSSENSSQVISPALGHLGSQIPSSASSDLACSGRYGLDDGRGCWNLLFSRLFFDAKRSVSVNSFIKGRIQRSLSNMRTPSYIGGITCTSLNLGNLPPYICSMRVLPVDEDQVWAFEANIEYTGGIALEIETRLEVREPDFQKGLLDSNMERNTAAEVTSALLGGLECHSEVLYLASDSTEKMENKTEKDKPDGLGQSKSTSWASRYKSIVNSIAEHVSQVPISLSLRISSLRGTLRVHIKPPPSDQLWFGFTSMPEIEWSLDSSVGDCKVSNGHVTSLLSSRFKTAIQETLVLPNCESVSIPWMLAEKDDWVPRSVAPFIWVARRDAGESPADEVAPPTSHSGESVRIKKGSSGDTTQSIISRDDNLQEAATAAGPPGTKDSGEMEGGGAADPLPEDLGRPSPVYEDPSLGGGQRCSRRESTAERSTCSPDDGRPRTGRKTRMMDLGRKVTEKLEEKRRHIEEKSRHMVEKMLENVEKRV